MSYFNWHLKNPVNPLVLLWKDWPSLWYIVRQSVRKKIMLFEETEAYDALIIKLTRNSDVFFQQIVKGYFKLKGEDNLLFIDRINLLEKIGVIESADGLMELKSFRNQAVHEYSAVAFQELYEEALQLTPFFQKTVSDFMDYLKKENVLEKI